MKRITRNRRLTPEEAAKYKVIREQVADELPDLIARHPHREIANPHGLERLEQIMQLIRRKRVDKLARHRRVRRRPGRQSIGFIFADGFATRPHGFAPDEIAWKKWIWRVAT